MRKTTAALLLALSILSCKTTVEPIEIDLSKRTPAASPAQPATPTPAPEGAAPPPAAPGPESAAPPTRTPRAATARAPSPATAAAPPGPAQTVDAQLEAYNRHDLEDFLLSYATDAVLYEYPDRVRQRGLEEIRRAYSKMFAETPGGRARKERMVQGNFVIDQEEISGLAAGGILSAVVIYEVRNGKIQRVWFLR